MVFLYALTICYKISLKMNSKIDRKKRDFLLFLMKATGAFWLSKYFPLYGCSSSGAEEKIDLSFFPQSVVSGDVTQNSCILWTRTSMPGIPVVCQVSEKRDFSNLVFNEVFVPSESSDNTIKVKVLNLRPGTQYYYRFVKDKSSSPVGTFKTVGSNPERIRFAVVSCQDYSNGFYSAWYHISNEKIDFVVHLGDYIYETLAESTFQYSQLRKIELQSGRKVALELNDYRDLYKVYKSDKYLQMAHERFPFYIIWDDHEFANDAAYTLSPDNGKELWGKDEQVERRLQASQAWYEYIPADVYFDPKEQDPKNQIKIYRKFDFGTLARLFMTDERLYRSPHPCGEGTVGQRYLASCDNIETTTMLGQEQLDWFLNELKKAEDDQIIWKIHGNEVCISQMLLGKAYLNLDQWDGFAGERGKIFNHIAQNEIKNYFVVTGDLHTFVVGELYDDFFNPSKRVGVEFAATSITSSNLGSLLRMTEKDLESIEKSIVDINKNLKYFNSHYHGYAICDITPEEAIVELWRVSSVEDPQVENTEKILVKKYRVKRNTNTVEDIT